MNKYDSAFINIKSNSYSLEASESLIEFRELFRSNFNHYSDPSILELGCGPFLYFYNDDSIGVEISKQAIELASQEQRRRMIESCVFEFNSKDKFDIIFDSHLLHCLNTKQEVAKYIKKVHHLLSIGGSFILECMVRPKKLVVDEGFLFDEDLCTLSFDGEVHRVILSSLELEKIVQDCGLKIVYLRVDETIKFVPYSHRSNSLATDPDRLRMICIKDKNELD